MKLFWQTLIFSGFITAFGSCLSPLHAQLIQKTDIQASDYLDTSLWHSAQEQALLDSINQSLKYLDSGDATQDYANYPITAFSRDKVKRSLLRFRALLLHTQSPEELQQAIAREFDFYQAVGTDNQGKVDFTAYFEPTYTASTVRTETYKYPLYRKPANFSEWSTPHPTRLQLEGKDGIAPANSPLRGSELVWLSDRLEAYLIQVQGSARLQLTNGKTMSIGFGGSTDYGYTSLGKEVVNDGVFTLEELSLPKLLDYFESHPEKLSDYIPRNNRFIFFRETYGSPPLGSLGVPVTAERSIATDKSLMPPGAIALISTQLPYQLKSGRWLKLPTNRYVLDQDTGSAIKGPGRVDIFLGTGTTIQERAGLVNDAGQLYYLLLKE